MGNNVFVFLGFALFFLLVYKLFELFVRRRERLILIEKIEVLNKTELSGQKIQLPGFSNFSFSALKAACLLIGLGLGVLIAFLICSMMLDMYGIERMTGYASRVEANVYCISVLLCGGIGLLVSFLWELRNERKEKAKQE